MDLTTPSELGDTLDWLISKFEIKIVLFQIFDIAGPRPLIKPRLVMNQHLSVATRTPELRKKTNAHNEKNGVLIFHSTV